VRLRAPDETLLVIKDFGQPDPGSADVLSFYQTKGPGLYKIVLQEKSGCHTSSTADNASITSTELVVQQACP
jgi:hypothetical protein